MSASVPQSIQPPTPAPPAVSPATATPTSVPITTAAPPMATTAPTIDSVPRTEVQATLGIQQQQNANLQATLAAEQTRAVAQQQQDSNLRATLTVQQTQTVAQQQQISVLQTAVAQKPTMAPSVSQAQPMSTSIPTAPPRPQCQSGSVCYEADWSRGIADWAGSADWKVVDGMLVNDGTTYQPSVIVAPFRPDTGDYAIEAKVQMVRRGSGNHFDFGIVLRGSQRGEYKAGVTTRYAGGAMIAAGDPWNAIEHTKFDPGLDWRTYRVEAKGDKLKLFVGEALLVEVIDSRFLAGMRIGLWDALNTPIRVT